MSEQGGFARAQQQHSLFRSWCDEVSDNAGHLRQYLSGELDSPLEPGPTWCNADVVDVEALPYLSELESSFDNLLIMVPGGDPEDYDQKVDAQIEDFLKLRNMFHTTLPFDEAERIWFLKAYRGDLEPVSASSNVLTAIGNQEARIVTVGIRQLVSGRELVRRWLAWRRETGEYGLSCARCG